MIFSSPGNGKEVIEKRLYGCFPALPEMGVTGHDFSRSWRHRP